MTTHTEPTMVERRNSARKRVVERKDGWVWVRTPETAFPMLYGAYYGDAILSEGE